MTKPSRYLFILFAGLIGILTVWSVPGLARGTSHEAAVLDVLRPAGPVSLDQPLPDTVATAGDSFVYEIPPDTFSDTDNTHTLTYTTGPLPGWLSFDPTTNTFSGVPSNSDHTTGVDIEVIADDSNGNTNSDIFSITVQAIPVVDINGPVEFGINYNEAVLDEEGPDIIPITHPQTTTSDQDGTTLTKAIISLSDVGLYDPSVEYLLVTAAGKAFAQAAGLTEPTYNPVSGDIIITGEAPFEDYARVLQEVRYVNTSEDLQSGTRSVVFIVNDKDDNEANAAISSITIVPVNDPVTLDLDGSDGPDGEEGEDNGTIKTYVEDTPAIRIVDNTVSLEDVDYADNGSFTLRVINRLDGEQEKFEVVQPLPAGISASFDVVTGVMTLSGSATLDEYEEAIQRIGYINESQDPDDTQRRIAVTFSDGDGDESTSTALMNVVPVNDAPDRHIDDVLIAEYSLDNPVVMDTLPSDIDNEIEELTAVITSLPDLGTVTYADGTPLEINDRIDATQLNELQYDSPNNYNGTDIPGKLEYDVLDIDGASTPSEVTFIINNAPEAQDFTVTTDEDVPYTFSLDDFAAGYTDTEDDALAHIVISSLPDQGLLLLAEDTVRRFDEIRITALDSGLLTFVPELDENGLPYTSFLFRAKDVRGAASELHVVTIDVNPVSDPPRVDTVMVSGKENFVLFFTADDFKAQYYDPEGDTLTKVRIDNLPSDGVLEYNGIAVTAGDEISVDSLSKLSFVPDRNFDGVTEFQWNGHDGMAYADEPAPVIITIFEDNLLSAVNDTIYLIDITVYDGTLVGNVRNPQEEAFSFETAPVIDTQHGTLTLRADGSYTYQTTEDFAGEDSFTYRVCNADTPPHCAEASVIIVVAEPLRVYEGFSPDGDGVNDRWRIENIENYPNNVVRIFNRWGNQVFEMESYNNEDRSWNSDSDRGLIAGDVPDGTYFYLIELGTGRKPLSGYVIINR